ncbi:hypothetical protein [Solirubrobacter soli]|uniref:hypothetical protein n=1 Tax=Solirubrobacter soli TaxID=363832 RepID=UPI0005635425|nr:hypothetical protein [Solirubrobacter soli]
MAISAAAALLGTTAPPLSGRVVVLCAHEPLAVGMYEIFDGRLARLTDIRRIDAFSVANGQVAFSYPIDLLDHVVVADREATPYQGTVIGPGHSPALGTDGRLAFARLVERDGRLADQIVTRAPDGAFKDGATYKYVWGLAYVRESLTAFVQDKGKFEVIRSAGGADERHVRIHMRSAGRIAFAADGRFAYGIGQAKGARLRIVSESDRQIASYGTDWQPSAWSPDGRQLLVARTRYAGGRFRRPQLGLMNPATGKVKALSGPLPCGAVVTSQWLAG